MSIIFTYYTDGSPITLIRRSKIDDMYYSLYAAKNGSILGVIDLDFDTDAHIVGIGKGHLIDSEMFNAYIVEDDLEEIFLEGDFINEYSIYAQKCQGKITQYILDPSAMKFAEDYYRNGFWEIVENEMYVVCEKYKKHGDDFINEALKFVEQIRPTLTKKLPGTHTMKHQVPLGVYEGDPLPCPICDKEMPIKDHWLECPSQDGIFILASNLVKLRNRTIPPPDFSSKSKSHGNLTCPNCHSDMQSVNYNAGRIKIDSCTNCSFRWLDCGEIQKIINNESDK